jgi:hypothetical protein
MTEQQTNQRRRGQRGRSKATLEAEVLTYVAEFASLFPELDEMREPKSVLEENRKP